MGQIDKYNKDNIIFSTRFYDNYNSVEEWCECRGEEEPFDEIQAIEEFNDDLQFMYDNLQECLSNNTFEGVLIGEIERWNGTNSYYRIVSSLDEILQYVFEHDDTIVYLTKKSLTFEECHHDGVNRYEFRPFNKRGQEIYDDIGDEIEEYMNVVKYYTKKSIYQLRILILGGKHYD